MFELIWEDVLGLIVKVLVEGCFCFGSQIMMYRCFLISLATLIPSDFVPSR